MGNRKALRLKDSDLQQFAGALSLGDAALHEIAVTESLEES